MSTKNNQFVVVLTLMLASVSSKISKAILYVLLIFVNFSVSAEVKFSNLSYVDPSIGGVGLIKTQTESSPQKIIEAPPPVTIKGKVTNENGEPVPGVNVQFKGTKIAATTDAEGKYTISSNESPSVLIFTHLNYSSVEINTNNQLNIDVQLKAKYNELDDVVIVGYGTQKRKDLTGSITSVNLKENEASQYGSVDALIRGRAPGVNVSTNNAGPGASISVKIRGVNSLRGDNQPLYVVDGIIMDSPTENESNAITVGNYNAQEVQNGLTGINPRDIESIDILKDASATAIYGSRGANGVVLITTKQGKGNAKLSFETTTSVDVVSKKIPVLDGITYAKYQNEIRKLRGEELLYTIDNNDIIREFVPSAVLAQFPDSIGRLKRQVNWQDEVYRPTISQNHRISISGSVDKTKYFLALGLLNQEGVVKGSNLTQGDIRLNLQKDISQKLKVTGSINAVLNKNNMIIGTESSGLNNLIRNVTASPPLRTSVDDFLNQGIVDEFEDLVGPETFIAGYDDRTEEFRLMTSLKATYAISKVFSYQLNFGGDLRVKNRERWQGPETSAGRLYNGMAGQSNLNRVRYNLDNLLLFNKSINKNNKIDGTIGTVLDENYFRSQAVQGSDYSLNSLRFNGISFANVSYPIRLTKSKTSLLSGLARINYTFLDRYLFSVSVRADGSSKFAEGNKFSYFPSAAVAWKVMNENFLKESKVFSDLKLRISWGETGNQGIGPYGTYTQYSFASYPNADDNLAVGTSVATIANNDLRWETTKQLNAGIDFGLFNNRLTGTIDVFNKKTSNLLQTIQLPTSAGFKTMLVNLGDISNKGLELGLNAVLLDKKVKLEVGGNISFVRNKIEKLGLSPSEFGTEKLVAFLGNKISNAQITDPANIFIEGRPIGLFWGYQTNGVYYDSAEAAAGPKYLSLANQPGDVVYVDQNGDGIINDLDRT
ncbi:MAG: SusC/RagA family TonB-linked outer membrane protein, partial [Janthinobacterium sp.]